jgi:hypothetical protein
MNEWVKRQYDDIKGNMKWAVLCGLWLLISTGVKKILQRIPNMPDWAVWGILILLAIAAFLLVARWNPTKQLEASTTQNDTKLLTSSGVPTISAITGKDVNLDHLTLQTIFGRSYFSPISKGA